MFAEQKHKAEVFTKIYHLKQLIQVNQGLKSV